MSGHSESRLLGATRALAEELEQVLQSESAALTRIDIPAIVAASQNKQRIYSQLSRCLDAPEIRNQLTAAHDHMPDPRIRALRECLDRCRMLNELAGSTIAMLLGNTRDALGLLGVTKEPPAYGASGRNAPAAGGRALAVC